MQNFALLGISENFQPIEQTKLTNSSQFYIRKPVNPSSDAKKTQLTSSHDLKSIK